MAVRVLDRDGRELVEGAAVRPAIAEGRQFVIEALESDGALLCELHSGTPLRRVSPYRRILHKPRTRRCPDLELIDPSSDETEQRRIQGVGER